MARGRLCNRRRRLRSGAVPGTSRAAAGPAGPGEVPPPGRGGFALRSRPEAARGRPSVCPPVPRRGAGGQGRRPPAERQPRPPSPLGVWDLNRVCLLVASSRKNLARR